MNTKEAIKFCKYMIGRNVIEGRNEKYENIIRLLQRSEKYEQMWEKFKKRLNEGSPYIGESGDHWWGCIAEDMEEMEQKYFPK